jgi:hypothetical protein
MLYISCFSKSTLKKSFHGNEEALKIKKSENYNSAQHFLNFSLNLGRDLKIGMPS